jgi:cob(I)alamin adenosyltransferase
MSKIYTKTGDTGETGMATGERVSKTSPAINLVGVLDECNSQIGLSISFLNIESLKNENPQIFVSEIKALEKIQKSLFVLGSIASGANLSFDAENEVKKIEDYIDAYESLLPELKNFILPGGSLPSSAIHVSRSCLRKCERVAVKFSSQSKVEFLPFLNRLSDLLFVMARYINMKLGYDEKIWKKDS